MSGYWLDIALVGALVLLNAVFAGSEMALVSLREGQLRQLERTGGARGERLVRLARDPNRFLATIQIGITLAGFLASATAAVSLAEPLVPQVSFLGSAAEPVVVAARDPGAGVRHPGARRARPQAARDAAAPCPGRWPWPGRSTCSPRCPDRPWRC